MNLFTNKPQIMSDDLRRRMFEKNMAKLADAFNNGPDVVQRYWEKDWHELNVTLDIREQANDIESI
jgi:hypothetical protein